MILLCIIFSIQITENYSSHLIRILIFSIYNVFLLIDKSFSSLEYEIIYSTLVIQ